MSQPIKQANQNSKMTSQTEPKKSQPKSKAKQPDTLRTGSPCPLDGAVPSPT